MKYNAFAKPIFYNSKTELKKINLFSNDEEFSAQLKFYFNRLTYPQSDLSKIAVNQNQTLSDLIVSKPNQLTAEQFYTIILQILDFHLGVDFTLNKSIDFLNKTNQNILKEKKVSLNNLPDFIFNALNLRAANGLSLIDNLINDNFLINFEEKSSNSIFFAGKSLPVFHNFIKENYYIDTQIDTDEDGYSDRVLVQITRPTSSNKIPVILCANPYYKGTNEMNPELNSIKGDLKVKDVKTIKLNPISEYKIAPSKVVKNSDDKSFSYSANQESLDFPLNNFFLARGFAVAYVAGLGTRGSQGMRTTGDRAETITCCKTIEFLSGNEPGYINKNSKKQITLNWCNGAVAMTGRSYLGTLATAAATQNPKGLKTIISESAISNWYNYYRENGLVVAPGGFPGEDADVLALDTYSRWYDGAEYLKTAETFKQLKNKMKHEQDRVTGNYNQFWQNRNYLLEADQIKIDCLYVHGLNDWNVKPINLYQLYHKAKNAHLKLILHQGQHISPHNIQSLDYLDICNFWLTNHLYNVDNKITKTLPNIIVQNNRNPDTWKESKIWGKKQVKSIKLGQGSYTYCDNLSQIFDHNFNHELNNYESSFALKNPIFKRSCFILDIKLQEALTINGQAKIKINIKTNAQTGLLSAALFEINPTKLTTTSTTPVENRFFQLVPNQERVALHTFKTKSFPYRLITFGHINLQNIDGPAKINQVKPQIPLDLNLDLQPTIYELVPDSKLRLILFGSDMKYTIQVKTPQEYTLNLDRSTLFLPY